MKTIEEWFGLPAATLSDADCQRLAVEAARRYPQLVRPSLHPVGLTTFYDGCVLLRVEDEGEPVRYAVAWPAMHILYVLDGRGESLDRIERLRPPKLNPTNIASYLRFRFAFLRERQDYSFGLVDVVAPVNAEDRVRVTLFKRRLVADEGAAQRDTFVAEALVHIKDGAGIVHVKCEQWRYSADALKPQLDEALARDQVLASADVVRIPAPYFVDRWEERFTPPPAAPKELNPPPLDDPFESLLRGFDVSPERRHAAMIRSTSLPFYRSFRLFELSLLEGKGEPGYCLGREADGKWEFLWLNGQSLPIHQANERRTSNGEPEIDLPAVDEVPEGTAIDDRLSAYIRFFCWAVEGEDGPFFTVSELGRLELVAAPGPATIEAVDSSGLLPAMRRATAVEIDAAIPENAETGDRAGGQAGLFRMALAFYGGHAFRALFRAQPGGMLDMLSDDPLGDDLTIDIDSARADRRRRWREAAGPPALPAAGTAGEEEAAKARPPTIVEAHGEVTYERHIVEDRGFLRARLRAGLGHRFVDCRFPNGLDLRGCTIDGSLQFERCVFESDGDPVGHTRPALHLADAKLAGTLRLSDCHLRADMDLDGARIDQHFELLGCSIVKMQPERALRELPLLLRRASGKAAASFVEATAYSLDPGETTGLNCMHASVGKDVRIGLAFDGVTACRTLIAGSARLNGLQVGGHLLVQFLLCGGDIDVSDACVRADVMLGMELPFRPFVSLECRTIQATGLEASSVHSANIRIGDEAPHINEKGEFVLRHARIGRALTLFGCTIGGDLDLYDACVEGNLNLSTTVVKGNISAAFARIRLFFAASSRGWRSIFPYTLHCTGDIELSGATLGGLELSGVRVDGELIANTGSFGCIYLDPALVRPSAELEVEVCRIRRVVMRNIEVRDLVRLRGIEIGLLPGSLLERMAGWLARRVETGVRIENSLIRGDLETLPFNRTMMQALQENHAESLQADQHARDTLATADAFHGGRCPPAIRHIVGDFHLRANEIEGSLRLEDMVVLGKVTLADSVIGIDLSMAAQRALPTGFESGLATRCVDLDLEKIECQGDVDLTGLLVQRETEVAGHDDAPPSVAAGQASLVLRDATVRGEVRLVSPDGAVRASIAGRIDLSALKANRLTVTRENVAGPDSPDGGAGARLSLERAELSRLDVLKPVPASIDLTAIKVARWSFGTEQGGERVDSSYIEVLERMDPIDRGVWISVESMLRAEGSDREANAVYLGMRRQVHSKMTGAARFWDSIKSIVIGHGAKPWRPFYLWAPAFLVLSIVLGSPHNVEPRSDLIQAREIHCTAVPPSPAACDALSPATMKDRWAWLDGVGLALRYGVPVIDLLSEQEWKASRRPISAQLPVSAALIAGITSLLGWIAWPIFLLFAGARVIRGRRE